ncbi:MAG: thiol peroxidase [Acidimicrobiales bacterium]
MAEVTLGGNPIHTNGDLPTTGAAAPAFTLAKADLSSLTSADLAGQNVVLNIFPSIDTPTCANSVRAFNERAAGLDNTTVVCVSADLPFAQGRFCGAEGIENVVTASTFKNSEFLTDYGVLLTDGKLEGLAARAVVVIGPDGNVAHTELVGEIANEPDYDAALAAIG